MEKLQRYFDAIEAELSKIEYAAEPDGLYAPVRYELSLGGKRVRPLLTLLACEMFAGDYRRALNAAVGLEVFHNFTLLHDDVMDKADVRRGKPTVHKVWDENTAILSGDAMEIIAFRYIARTEAPHTGAVVELFLKTALEICEGQQYDMEFERRDDVTGIYRDDSPENSRAVGGSVEDRGDYRRSERDGCGLYLPFRRVFGTGVPVAGRLVGRVWRPCPFREKDRRRYSE